MTEPLAWVQSIICQVCRSTFLCTSSYAKLVEHADSKHPGKGGAQLCNGTR